MPYTRSANVLRDIEEAIETKNFGRMNEIGVSLILMAKNDNAWLEAVVVITGYLNKSPPHIWDAVNLSKQAAIMAPEHSNLQRLAIQALTTSINSFTDPTDKIEAAYSVVVVAPRGSVILVVSLETMLENIEKIDSSAEKMRYSNMVIHYSEDHAQLMERARIIVEREKTKPAANTNEKTPEHPLMGFLDKYKSNLKELFNPPDPKDKSEKT